MEDGTKNLYDVLLGFAQLFVITIGALWAFWRFRRERVYAPKIDFDVICNFVGLQKDFFITEIVLSIKNQGLIRHQFNNISLLVRGIEKDKELTFFGNEGFRLEFPIKILEDNVVYKKKYNYVFVEPNINQELTYVTKISSQMKVIIVRAEFNYDESTPHSIERIFRLPKENL